MSLKAAKKRGLQNPNEPVTKQEFYDETKLIREEFKEDMNLARQEFHDETKLTRQEFKEEMSHAEKELIKLIFNLNELKKSLSLTKELNLKPETSLVKMGLKLDYQLSVITIRNQAQDILNYVKTNN